MLLGHDLRQCDHGGERRSELVRQIGECIALAMRNGNGCGPGGARRVGLCQRFLANAAREHAE